MGDGKTSTEILIAQMQSYMEFKKPWDIKFIEGSHTVKTWWNCAITTQNYIQNLAIKILSLTPQNISCERIFSVLGWFCNKRRSRYINIKFFILLI